MKFATSVPLDERQEKRAIPRASECSGNEPHVTVHSSSMSLMGPNAVFTTSWLADLP